ncbi:hypothetical protein LCGC14_0178390 [marine sediment metagenome]
MEGIRLLHRQQGSALIVSLVFLLLLTLASVSSIKSSINQERMAANVKFKNDSFQAAEAGLRIAEQSLQANVASYASVCSEEACNIDDAALDIEHLASPGSGWVQIPSSEDSNNMVVWYWISKLGSTLAPANTTTQGPGTLYRIVVVSYRGTTRTVLESVYALTIV